ncbi:MAG: hypothetical protein ACRYFZ_15660 [Janthinobacterium lividum]
MSLSLRLLATPLVAIALLLSTLGCSKKEDPVPATTYGNGHYKLDGINRNCSVQAVTTTVPSSASQPSYDDLKILLPTENSPTSEYLLLEFSKLTSQPNTAYTLVTMAYFPAGSGTGTLYSNNVTTLTATSNGGFLGTFSGKSTSATAPGNGSTHTITDGVFTEVHP